MDETWLAEQFEAHRARLRAIAGRMLGSHAEAEDVVQDVWLRLCAHGGDGVRDLAGWLTTVTARICLDQLRARARRPLLPLEEAHLPGDAADPEQAAVAADSVGAALLVVLDTLAPAERVAFVLHDLFGVPFAEIAVIVERSPDATKMLASRARRRIRGAEPVVAGDLTRQRAVVDAFLTAARGGDMAALLAVLDPDVVVRADAVASPTGAPIEVRGAPDVARQALSFAARAAHARPAVVDGSVGVLVAADNQLVTVLTFVLAGDRIAELGIVAEAPRLRALRLIELDVDPPRAPSTRHAAPSPRPHPC